MDAAGRFFHAEGAPGRLPDELIGKTVWEANPIVIEILQAARRAAGHWRNSAHSYPHCWRCHNPAIFRATEQWFIGMERNNFRQDALEAIKRVKWMPEWGEERISNMIATRPDWCISRQRVWGVPIIVFYCEGCREPLTDRKILDGIVALFAEHTADIWYERTAAELLPAGHHLRQVRRHGIHQGDRHSGRVVRFRIEPPGGAQRALRPAAGLPIFIWKAAISIAAGSTVRCWWARACKGGSPYRACALNGWVLDGEGRAMHKSLGNSIEPER